SRPGGGPASATNWIPGSTLLARVPPAPRPSDPTPRGTRPYGATGSGVDTPAWAWSTDTLPHRPAVWRLPVAPPYFPAEASPGARAAPDRQPHRSRSTPGGTPR